MQQMNWKGIAEFVGMGAIIASLIFVGLELRQQQRIALAAHYQERSRTAFDYFFGISEKEIWQRRQAEMVRRNFNFDELSSADRELLDNGTAKEISDWWVQAEISILIFDNLHFQYESGFSTEAAWQGQRERLKNILQFNSFARQQIKSRSSTYRPSFTEVTSRLFEEIEAGKQ